MTFRTLDDAGSLAGKTALVRVDFNVPMEDGKVTDDTRLRVAVPTIQRLRDAGAKVALLAHFDRPKGQRVPAMSLKPVVEALENVLGAPVRFALPYSTENSCSLHSPAWSQIGQSSG